MPDLLGLSHPLIEDMLGLGISVLTALMSLGLAVWFACSVAQNAAKLGWRVHRPSYDALWRENERLRESLVEARQQNDYLRKLYRNEFPPRRARKRTGETPPDERTGDQSRRSGLLHEELRPPRLFVP